jgi:hypothetical protein
LARKEIWKKILKISTLIYFWLPTGTKCRKYDPIFFYPFQIMAIKKFSIHFRKISPIIKLKKEPVASQSRKPWLKETPPDLAGRLLNLEGVPRPTLAARTRGIDKRN